MCSLFSIRTGAGHVFEGRQKMVMYFAKAVLHCVDMQIKGAKDVAVLYAGVSL